MSRLLWFDGFAGLTAGLTFLAFAEPMSRFFGLPLVTLRVMATANLLYSCYSLSLARRSRRPLLLVSALAIGNLLWAVVCVSLAVALGRHATTFGLLHLLLEGLFVGGLGAVEWRWRHRLLVAA